MLDKTQELFYVGSGCKKLKKFLCGEDPDAIPDIDSDLFLRHH